MAFCFFFLIPAFILPYFMHDPRYGKFFLFSVVYLVSLINITKRENYKLELNRFLFFAASGFSLFLIPSIGLSPIGALGFYSYVLIGLLVASFLKTSYFQENSIQKWTVISALFVASLAILNFYGISVFNIEVEAPFSRIAMISTIGNVNFVSDYLASILPVQVVSFFILETKKWRWGAYFSIIISSTAILWGQSRSVYISIFLSVCCFVTLCVFTRKTTYRFFKGKIKWIVFALLIVILLFIQPPGIHPSASPLSVGMQRFQELKVSPDEFSGSWYSRFFIWKTAIEMLRSSPVYGKGWGSFELLSADYQTKITHSDPSYYGFYIKSGEAHNDYLQTLSETGGAGFFLWIAVLFYIGFNGIRKVLLKRALLDIAFLCGWLVIVVHAFTEFPFHMMPSLSVFAIYSAFMTENVKKVVFPKWANLGVILVVVFFSYISLRVALSDSFYAIGLIEKNTAASQYQKAMSGLTEEKAKTRSLELNSTLKDSSDWLDKVFQKENERIVGNLNRSLYKQYLSFTNSVSNFPGNTFAAYEISTLIFQMERLSPRPPFILFDIEDFRYNWVSELRSVPVDFPVFGEWINLLRIEDREKIEYLYRFFKSVVYCINYQVDPVFYLSIGRAVVEILNEYNRLGVSEPSEISAWKEWMTFGFEKAIELKGMDDTASDSLWKEIDLEYLENLIQFGTDTRQKVESVLDHRLKLANYTLGKNPDFPSSWYDYYIELVGNGYFSDRKDLQEKYATIFKVYYNFYQSEKSEYEKKESIMKELSSEIRMADRLSFLEFILELKDFQSDYSERFLAIE